MRKPPDRPPTKAQLRLQLKRAMAEYRQKGGKIQEIPSGVSGREDESPYNRPLFETPPASRTPVDSVIRTIESRRKKPRAPAAKKPGKGPREKILYDDFGEPIRKIWVDD